MSLPPQVDLSGDRDCHCLGYDSQQQHYFLSHKSLEAKRKPPAQATKQENLPSLKNLGKRSLRKPLRAVFEPLATGRSLEPMQEYYT